MTERGRERERVHERERGGEEERVRERLRREGKRDRVKTKEKKEK